MRVALLRQVVTLGALALALAHLIWPTLGIDAITLALVALAIVPWLAPLFKSLELPGGWKVEFRDLQRVEAKASEAGLLPRAEGTPAGAAVPEHVFLSVAQRDPNLALAGLRIELEKRVVHIAQRHGIGTRMQGLGRLLQELERRGVLSEDEAAVLSEMVALLNEAVHGATVDPRATEWAMDVGPVLLQALDEKAA